MRSVFKNGLIIGAAVMVVGCSDSSTESKQAAKQVTTPPAAEVATTKVSYANDVLPILQNNCFECHRAGGRGEEASGLNMETYDGLMKGTKFGPVINPGNSFTSTLVMLVEGRANPVLKMPHGGRKPLDAQQIQTIKTWIDQGAENN